MTDEHAYLITKFVDDVLADEEPDNNCFIMCYTLSLYLSIYDIQHTIKSGNVNTPTKNIPHYVIALNNEEIIDPTAKQIDENNPKVLIGEMPPNYEDFKVRNNDEAYDDFEYQLLNDGAKKPLQDMYLRNLNPKDIEVENKRVDIVPYLRIFIRSACILKEIVSQNDQLYCPVRIGKYFLSTDKIVIKNENKGKELGNASLLYKFECLLVNAKSKLSQNQHSP